MFTIVARGAEEGGSASGFESWALIDELIGFYQLAVGMQRHDAADGKEEVADAETGVGTDSASLRMES